MKKIDTVYFDAGNVLIAFDHLRAFRQIGTLCDKSVDEVKEFYMGKSIHLDYECGKITTAELQQKFEEFSGKKLQREELALAASDIFFEISGMTDLVQQVIKSGVKVAIISNTCEIHWQQATAEHPIINLIQPQILSHEVGYLKPDERIYRDAFAATDSDPKSCLFIDDLQENIDAAEKLGITGHLFSGIDGLKEFLSSHQCI